MQAHTDWQSSRTALGLLGLSFLASILLRVPYYQHSLTFVDEGIYASIAAELLHGRALYGEIWCNHQPLVIYFCKWMFQIFGVNSAALHVGSLLLVLLESWLLYRIGSSFFASTIGGLAALAYAVISTNFYTPRIIGYTPEQLMVVFTTAAVCYCLHGLKTDRAGLLFWTGGLAVAAVLTKPAAGPELLMYPAFVFIASNRARHIRMLAWFALGTTAAAALFLAGLYASGNLVPWWTQGFVTRVFYVNQIGWAASAHLLARQPVSFGLVYIWLWILIWCGRAAAARWSMEYRLLWVWFAAALLGVIIGRRFYANYYIQVYPPLSLLAAAALQQMHDGRLWNRYKPAILAGAVALLLTFSWFQARTFAHWYFLMDPDRHHEVKLWDMCVLDRNQAEIARQIRSVTRPEDRIFVWGPSPEFYFLSGRQMATPYPFFDVMDRSQPPYGDEEQRTLLDLTQTPPRLIVDSFKQVKMADRPGWNTLLTREYDLYGEFEGARLYVRRPPAGSP